MTLHEAIIKIFTESNKSNLTTNEIADILNKKKYYVKKDKSEITAYQVHGRTNKYKDIFSRNGSSVSLNNQKTAQVNVNSKISNFKKIISESNNSDFELLEKVLMNEKNFKSCSKSEQSIPDLPGIYCIRIINPKLLPKAFADELIVREHNILYIGLASQSLNKRFLNQELRAKGHGTFFRSIGAILNYKPQKGSLRDKANKKNYKFNKSDEAKIIEWLNENILINWIQTSENLDNFETNLITKYKPIINIAKNQYSMTQLSNLRAECVRIANE